MQTDLEENCVDAGKPLNREVTDGEFNVYWSNFLSPESADSTIEGVAKSWKKEFSTETRCTKAWSETHLAYRCRDCEKSETSCMCPECFDPADHEGHNYRFYESSMGGCCDCGDESAWKKEGFCKKHKKENHKIIPIPSSVKKRVQLMTKEFVDYITFHLNHGDEMDQSLIRCVTSLLQIARCCAGLSKVVGEVIIQKGNDLGSYLDVWLVRMIHLNRGYQSALTELLLELLFDKDFKHHFSPIYMSHLPEYHKYIVEHDLKDHKGFQIFLNNIFCQIVHSSEHFASQIDAIDISMKNVRDLYIQKASEAMVGSSNPDAMFYRGYPKEPTDSYRRLLHDTAALVIHVCYIREFFFKPNTNELNKTFKTFMSLLTNTNQANLQVRAQREHVLRPSPHFHSALLTTHELTAMFDRLTYWMSRLHSSENNLPVSPPFDEKMIIGSLDEIKILSDYVLKQIFTWQYEHVTDLSLDFEKLCCNISNFAKDTERPHNSVASLDGAVDQFIFGGTAAFPNLALNANCELIGMEDDEDDGNNEVEKPFLSQIFENELEGIEVDVLQQPVSLTTPLHHSIRKLIQSALAVDPDLDLKEFLSFKFGNNDGSSEEMTEEDVTQEKLIMPTDLRIVGMRLADLPMRSMSFFFHILKKLWIRNGNAIMWQQFSLAMGRYWVDSVIESDLCIMQIGTMLSSGNDILKMLKRRLLPSCGDAPDGLMMYFFRLVCYLSTHSGHVGMSHKDMERHYIVRKLAIGNHNYRAISQRVPHLYADSEEFDDTLNEVAKYIEPRDADDSGLFQLKPMFWSYCNVFDPNVLLSDREKRNEAFKTHFKRTKGSYQSDTFNPPFPTCELIPVPQFPSDFHSAFKELPSRLLLSEFFLNEVFGHLQKIINREKGIAALTKDIFYALVMCLRCAIIYGDDQAKTSLFQRFLGIKESSDTSDLLDLLLHHYRLNADRDTPTEDLALPAYIIDILHQHCEEARYIIDEFRTEHSTEEKNTEEGKESLKAMQEARMKAFKSLQDDFEMDFDITDSEDDDIDENDDVILTDDNKAAEAKKQYHHDKECVLCREGHSEENPLNVMVYASPTRLPKAHMGARAMINPHPWMNFSDEEREKLRLRASDGAYWLKSSINCFEGVYKTIMPCGHHIHIKCFQDYIRSQYDLRRTHGFVDGDGAIIADAGEYLCPLCRRANNLILPLMDERHMKIKGIRVFENHKKKLVHLAVPFLKQLVFSNFSSSVQSSSIFHKLQWKSPDASDITQLSNLIMLKRHINSTSPFKLFLSPYELCTGIDKNHHPFETVNNAMQCLFGPESSYALQLLSNTDPLSCVLDLIASVDLEFEDLRPLLKHVVREILPLVTIKSLYIIAVYILRRNRYSPDKELPLHVESCKDNDDPSYQMLRVLLRTVIKVASIYASDEKEAFSLSAIHKELAASHSTAFQSPPLLNEMPSRCPYTNIERNLSINIVATGVTDSDYKDAMDPSVLERSAVHNGIVGTSNEPVKMSPLFLAKIRRSFGTDSEIKQHKSNKDDLTTEIRSGITLPSLDSLLSSSIPNHKSKSVSAKRPSRQGESPPSKRLRWDQKLFGSIKNMFGLNRNRTDSDSRKDEPVEKEEELIEFGDDDEQENESRRQDSDNENPSIIEPLPSTSPELSSIISVPAMDVTPAEAILKISRKGPKTLAKISDDIVIDVPAGQVHPDIEDCLDRHFSDGYINAHNLDAALKEMRINFILGVWTINLALGGDASEIDRNGIRVYGETEEKHEDSHKHKDEEVPNTDGDGAKRSDFEEVINPMNRDSVIELTSRILESMSINEDILISPNLFLFFNTSLSIQRKNGHRITPNSNHRAFFTFADLIPPTPFKLVPLPDRIDQLIIGASKQPCACGTFPTDRAICLICGRICCGNQLCKADDESKGGMTRHNIALCSAMTPFLQPSLHRVVVLVDKQIRRSHWSSLYVDEHGDSSLLVRNGKPLGLSQSRFDTLENMVVNQNFLQDTRILASIAPRNGPMGY
eukprot:TRINITY_DN1339_c0_g1_i9.p1 TRINITY_DN1339_c0_g1~~TRINITY_DN1339_c0_g1_i9.p1  ORF type:complete len:1999 (-),score=561.50 TRINITY_DN1339_c0_g1_i9:886-6882(-)